jgi:hypothetical protein
MLRPTEIAMTHRKCFSFLAGRVAILDTDAPKRY